MTNNTTRYETEPDRKMKGSKMIKTTSKERALFDVYVDWMFLNDPPNKETRVDVCDLLEEKEREIVSREGRSALTCFHTTLLMYLPYRLLWDGVEKEDIMSAVSKMCDFDLDAIKEDRLDG